MLVALTRPVPPSIVACELTHLSRAPIDVGMARAQHEQYEQALRDLGCRVERVAGAPDQPDSVFIEDTAIVFDELAIVTRPGAPSRRKEIEPVASALERYRRVRRIEAPATMDGGDVLCVGKRVFVGVSRRTSADGPDQLDALLAPLGYTVEGIRMERCLHLKSAVTAASDTLLVVNPEWIDCRELDGFDCIEVPPEEGFAANVVRIGAAVLCADGAPRTRRALEARGLDVRPVAASELAKAEGALTCCSLIFRQDSSAA